MLDTFEERAGNLDGQIQVLPIRSQFGPSDLGAPDSGWSLLDEAESGSAVMAALDVGRTVEGFTPNVTAMLWRIQAQVQEPSALTEGIVTKDIPEGFELLSRQNGTPPVSHQGVGRWFRDEFRMVIAGVDVDSYARLDVYPCAIAAAVFHALQRTHTTPAGYAGTVPTTRDVDMATRCVAGCGPLT